MHKLMLDKYQFEIILQDVLSHKHKYIFCLFLKEIYIHVLCILFILLMERDTCILLVFFWFFFLFLKNQNILLVL
jgi:hypothetical protein